VVFIVKDYARLIRWDRSGALVTAKIPFSKKSYLLDFFIRYNISSREAHGHNRTVDPPTQDEAERAKAIVPELREAVSLLAVEHLGNRYIICPPESQPYIPVGRWTRPSIAFDTRNERRVFLKVSWRVIRNDIQPEGVIYRRLHEAKVSNIPFLLSDGDVGNDSDEYHRSRTMEALDFLIPSRPCWNKLAPHRHYRIVLGVIGTRLEKFKQTWEPWELVNAVRAALEGEMTIFVAISCVT
jgi:hypothetical protein